MCIERLSWTALLSALALVLGFVETMVPVPVAIPGIKLGLSNVAVLIALEMRGMRCACAVAAVKVLAAGLLFGSPMMMAYSAGGTVLALGAMALCSRVRGMGLVVVSMVAAICHNAGQLAVAALFLQTPAVLINLAPLAVAACVTGAATGAVAAAVVPLARTDEALPAMELSGSDMARLGLMPGAVVAFAGANGSGKSSCARGLAQREGLGRVVLAFQDADGQIVAQTVRDDCAFGLENTGMPRGEMRERVGRVLARVGLADFEDADVQSLSGGQKQLLVLAGLVLMEPDVLIFDETTSMMDEDSREVFFELVDELAGAGACVVFVSHSQEEWRRAQRLVIFEEGRIAAAGPVAEVLADSSLLARAGLTSVREDRARAVPVKTIERGQEVSLMPDAGEVVGLSGPSGVGKTTSLVRLFERFGARAALVRQRPEQQLFAQTAFDDVAFGPRAEGAQGEALERRVRTALERVDLDPDAARERSPFSYSGGERRRLAIAGALALERDVLLLDEPTAGLDPVQSQRIWTLLDDLREEGRAVVVVSHDLAALDRHCTKRFSLAAPKAAAAHPVMPPTFGAYVPERSFVHGLDPRAKLVFAAAFLVVCALAQGPLALCALAAATFLCCAASQQGPSHLWRTVRPLAPLIVFIALFDALFVSSGEVMLAWGPLAVTSGGVALAAESIVRFVCALVGSSLLMATTRPVQLADAFVWAVRPLRSFGVRTEELAFGLSATLRFVPVLAGEFMRIRQAQEERGGRRGEGSLRSRALALVPIVVPLFHGAFGHARCLAAAALNRGFAAGKREPTCIREYRFSFADGAAIVFALALSACVAMLSAMSFA